MSIPDTATDAGLATAAVDVRTLVLVVLGHAFLRTRWCARCLAGRDSRAWGWVAAKLV